MNTQASFVLRSRNPDVLTWARTPLMRAIPAASPGDRSPLSAAPTVNFRTVVSRRLIATAPSMH